MENKVDIQKWASIITHPRLGEILLQRKKITLLQLDGALEEHFQTNVPLGEIMVNKNIIHKNDLVELLELQNEIDNILLKSIEEIKSSALNE